MEKDSAVSFLKYISKLESLLIHSVKSMNNYKKSIKNRLKK